MFVVSALLRGLGVDGVMGVAGLLAVCTTFRVTFGFYYDTVKEGRKE